MRVGFLVQAKQGDILEALQRRGWNQRQGAEFLSMNQSEFGRMINLKWVPKEFPLELEIKLHELTGKMADELFPEFARKREFLELPKKASRFLSITPEMLHGAGALFLPPSPEKIAVDTDLREKMDQVLKTLSPIQEKVVRGVIMEGKTHREMSDEIGVNHSRVDQILNKSLRVLKNKYEIPGSMLNRLL